MNNPVNRDVRYSEQELETIKKMYAEGATDNDMAVALGRPVLGISQKRHQLGLKRNAAPATRAWTSEETQKVREGVANGLTYFQISEALHDRSHQQVQSFACYVLGLHRGLRKFTPEEDDFLTREFLAYKPREEIAALLKRTVGALNQRILHLGLRREMRRTLLVKRFKEAATDPRSVDEIKAEIAQKDHAEKLQRSAEQEAIIADVLKSMIQALNWGASRRPVFQTALAAGATLQEIGECVGITRERVRQIVHGVTPANTLGTLIRRMTHLNPRDYALVTQTVEEERRKMLDGSPPIG